MNIKAVLKTYNMSTYCCLLFDSCEVEWESSLYLQMGMMKVKSDIATR